MEQLLQQLINGISLGSIYAFNSLGYTHGIWNHKF